MEHIKRILGIWVNPVGTFEAFPVTVKKEDWLIPLAIMLVFITGAAYLTAPMATELRYEIIASNPDIPEEQRAEMLDNMDMEDDKMALIMLVMAIGGALLWYLMQSGIVFGLSALTLGTDAPFISFWALVVLVNTTTIVEYLIKLPLIFITGNLQIETGLSILLPASLTESFLHNFLFQFDVFSIWRVSLLGLAISIIHNVDRKKAFMSLFGLWIVYALIAAAFMNKTGLYVVR